MEDSKKKLDIRKGIQVFIFLALSLIAYLYVLASVLEGCKALMTPFSLYGCNSEWKWCSTCGRDKVLNVYDTFQSIK